MRKAIPLLLCLILALGGCRTMSARSPFGERQVRTLAASGFVRHGADWQLGVLTDRLTFPTDQSRLDPTQLAPLARIAAALLAVGIDGARVEGHTDSTGTPAHNRQLSLERAIAVKQAMVSAGMAADRIRVVGLASRFPVESNRTAAGRYQNRRVVIIVSPPATAGR